MSKNVKIILCMAAFVYGFLIGYILTWVMAIHEMDVKMNNIQTSIQKTDAEFNRIKRQYANELKGIIDE